MAARPVAAPVPATTIPVLFVGSGARAQTSDGRPCSSNGVWPSATGRNDQTHVPCAGTVSQEFGPPAEGCVYLGHGTNLVPRYSERCSSCTPASSSSGLIEDQADPALELGKAVVATSSQFERSGRQMGPMPSIGDESEAFAARWCQWRMMNDASTYFARKRRLDTLASTFFAERQQCYGRFVREC